MSITGTAYTCTSCHVIFDNGELQRAHYQSDWHRYNLRRKVADLPPVTEIVYKQRSDQLQQQVTAQEQQQLARSSTIWECKACRKLFSSQNSFYSHLQSRKHVENASKFTHADASVSMLEQRTKATQEVAQKPFDGFIDADATEEEIRQQLQAKLSLGHRLLPTDCIFCHHKGDDFEANLLHMTKVHGLYIPDLDFVEDFEGLLAYLADKVGVAYCCLYCSAKVAPFASLEAVRSHMADKGHQKIRFDEEGMEELAEFYRYSVEQVLLSDDGDEAFEDIDGAEGEEWDEQQASDSLIISPDETELILPSGKRIGHRAYRIYYRQHLRVSPEDLGQAAMLLEEDGQRSAVGRSSRPSRHQALIDRMRSEYSALGATAAAHLHMSTKDSIDQRAAIEHLKERQLQQGVRNNMLQTHFRYQLRQ